MADYNNIPAQTGVCILCVFIILLGVYFGISQGWGSLFELKRFEGRSVPFGLLVLGAFPGLFFSIRNIRRLKRDE